MTWVSRILIPMCLMFILFRPVHANESATYVDLQGKSHRIEDYKGKWIVVNFWATWCPPCRKEIPDLVDFHQAHHQKNAVVLGIHFDDAVAEKVNAFVKKYAINYPVILMSPDRFDELGRMMGPIGPIPAMPTTYLIDPDGKTVARQVGPVTSQMLESFIQQRSDQSNVKQRPTND